MGYHRNQFILGLNSIYGNNMTAEEELIEGLERISPDSAISLIVDIANYIPAIRGLIKYTGEKNYNCIYITCTIPTRVICDQMESEEISTEHIYFIDCISFMVGSGTKERERTIFIESPAMLENILLKVSMWLKKLKEEDAFILLDSISTLSMHNDEKLLQEFVHYFVNNLRAKGIPSVIISVEGQTPEDLEAILKLVCNETVIIKGEEEEEVEE